ncbi:hypothetical protein Tco_0829001 [Tanacetum coccineum]
MRTIQKVHCGFIDVVNDLKTQGVIVKTTAWNEFSSTMAFAIICLATNQKFNFSKYILDNMVKNVDSMVKFWMYPRFVQIFMNKKVGDMSYHKRIYVTPSHTKKIFRNMKREGKGFSGRVTPLFQTIMVQAHEEIGEGSEIPIDPHHTPIIQPSTSQPQKKQSKRKQIKDTEIPQSSGPTDHIADEVANEENVPTQSNDPTSLKILDLETTKTTQAKEIASLKKRVKKLERKRKSKNPGMKRLFKIGRYAQVVSSEDEEIKAAKPKVRGVMIQERSEFTTKTTPAASKPSQDKGKAKMIESEEPLKMKQKDQDKVETDYELAQRLQAEEQEELTIEEKSKLFQQLLEKRRKHFAAKRAEERRRWKPKDLKNKSFASIQELCENAMKRVNTFIDMDTELVEGSEIREEERSSKKGGDELEQEPTKKQKVDDDKER